VLGEGQLGKAEQLGEHRRDHAGGAVGRLRPADDEVGRLGLDRGGEHLGGCQGVSPGQRVVADVDGAVGAHAEALADGVGGFRRAHRHQDDLGVAGRLLDPQRGLDAVFVAGIEDDLAVAGEPVVSG